MDKLIYQMLIENTGTHFLDSGGESNRLWQKNQGKTLEDFKNEEAVWFDDFKAGDSLSELGYGISVFHYLTMGWLELDYLCNEFNSMVVDDWSSDMYGVSAEGQEWLESHGLEMLGSDNTYNYPEAISQTLQYNLIKLNGEPYILLQVHGGCDVRGGYTDAKLFKFNDIAGYGLDDPMLYPQDVYGYLTRQDKRYKSGERMIEISNSYNGETLTDNEGNDIKLKDSDKLGLSINEY